MAGETVALEVTITPELRREGLAREFIRLVQDARKSDGLDVTDRVSVRWSTADQNLAEALTEHQALISAEVLAVDFGPQQSGPGPETGPGPEAGDEAPEPSGLRRHDSTELGLVFWLRPL